MPSIPVEPKPVVSAPIESNEPIRDDASARRIAALLTTLQNEPGVRSDVVARGRALASDPDYPPPEVIKQLAGLLVSETAIGQ